MKHLPVFTQHPDRLTTPTLHAMKTVLLALGALLAGLAIYEFFTGLWVLLIALAVVLVVAISQRAREIDRNANAVPRAAAHFTGTRDGGTFPGWAPPVRRHPGHPIVRDGGSF